jgi:hypothetical protein
MDDLKLDGMAFFRCRREDRDRWHRVARLRRRRFSNWARDVLDAEADRIEREARLAAGNGGQGAAE